MLKRRTIKGAKRIAYQLIEPDSQVGQPMYRLLADLVEEHHEEIEDARIALAWCTSWRPDVDGRVTLGKCKKASDLDRELQACDVVILLSKFWWQDLAVSAAQRAALLDHELCHVTVKLDDRTHEPTYDERGRKVYRTRKHDLEEFEAVVARHGCYKRDLESFAKTLLEKAATEPFTACDTCAASPGWVPVTLSDGTPGVTRCACYTNWSARRREALAS